MSIKLNPANDRGFLVGRFKDQYGKDCSIQKSSAASQDCIWLGRDHADMMTDGVTLARMHLTRKMAADLLPLLTRFANTGDL